MKKWSWWVKALVILVVLFGVIQLIPYGKDHTNPAVVAEPVWKDTTTQNLVARACYDCHSNETTWPWYSNVAPASWLLAHDVEEARQNLNFSDWPSNPVVSQALLEGAVKMVQEGEMPPFYYVWMHPIANLSAAEKSQLVQGLQDQAK
ncbi:MAG: heme-binding domain-containing protein [Anaerolineaceae bacterium]|nr:heme-binding domain-containing protein [Anaerolineaceae bacterium]